MATKYKTRAQKRTVKQSQDSSVEPVERTDKRAPRDRLDEAVISAAIERVRAGARVEHICAEPGQPSVPTLYRHLKKAGWVRPPKEQPAKERRTLPDHIVPQYLILKVLERISIGESLNEVCKDPDMPSIAGVYGAIMRDGTGELAKKYTQAMVCRADVKFNELEEIGVKASLATHSSTVNGLRLLSDNIKWCIARLNPRKYGERLENVHTGTVEVRNITRKIIKAPRDVDVVDVQPVQQAPMLVQ